MLEENMGIEILIEQKGSGIDPVLETNLGVNAQALRNMSILSDNTTKANVLGYAITVPMPEAYIIHKMVINKERKEKAEKDAESILNLFDHIDKDKLLKVYDELDAKSKGKVREFMSKKMKLDLVDLGNDIRF